LKAALLVRKGHVDLQEFPEEKIKTPDEALVQLDALSICRTDLEIIHGPTPTKKMPIVIGHEGSGTILEVGENVDHVKPGDHVLIDPNSYDLTCPTCRKGLTNLCPNGGLLGRDGDGVFREKFATHARNFFRIPDSIPVPIRPMIQQLSTTVHALNQIRIEPGHSVLVLGLGVTGLLLVQLAKLKGAYVVGTSTLPGKLELGRKLGMDAAIDRAKVELVPSVMALTERRGVDIAIETSGLPQLQRMAVETLAPGGTLLQFGVSGEETSYSLTDAYLRELIFKASRSSQPRDFVEAIELVGQGKIDLEYLVSGVVPFDHVAAAIELSRDRVKILKIVMLLNT